MIRVHARGAGPSPRVSNCTSVLRIAFLLLRNCGGTIIRGDERLQPLVGGLFVAAYIPRGEAWIARNAATCQTPATESRLELGTRVRVSSSAPGFFGPPMVGNVLAQRGDSLSLRPERTQDSITLPLASISQLEVRAGRHSQIGKGMGLGFLSGALIGAVYGAAVASNSHSPFGAGEAAALVGLTGGFLGISVGGAIGAMWRTENWERVSAVGAARLGSDSHHPRPVASTCRRYLP
jgi:hypothetical protein